MSVSVDPQTERALARVGQTLRDKWRLERLLGVGGMAAVYAAVHRNGMRGAVKMLHFELGSHADAKERFLREGYAANRVDHPGVVRVLDDDTAADGSVFLVMELLEGQTVDAFAESRPEGRLEVAEVLAIGDMLLDVLAAAHDKGIVHRDLKPENLFLTSRGELKVLDFGIARVREIQSASSRATQTGAAMGTPAFMPPEQASGQWNLVDARTDLWAVGATMFSLITGRLVHEAPTVQLLMAAAMTKPAPSLATVARDVPPAVATIVDTALAFERERRFPDARSMQRAVRAARSNKAISFIPPGAAAIPGTAGDAAADTFTTTDNATLAAASTNAPFPTARGGGSRWFIVGAVLALAASAGIFFALHRSDAPLTTSTATDHANTSMGTSTSAATAAPPELTTAAPVASETPALASSASAAPAAPIASVAPRPTADRAKSPPRPAASASPASTRPPESKREGMY